MLSLVVNAQNFGKVNLGLVMPEEVDDINSQQLSKLQTKIEAICARNEIANGYISDGFIIYPIIEVGDFDIIEGGVQIVYSTNLSLTLIVKQMNGVGINSMSKSYKGNGYSKEKAVSNAISSLSIQDGAYKQFLGKSRDLITNYYETHCNELIRQAKILANESKCEKAVAMLSAIPENIPSYSKVSRALKDVHVTYINSNCKNNISKAKAAMASNDYKKAAGILSLIPSSSPCYSEVEKMLGEMKASLDEKQKQEWDFQIRQYEDNKEKERLIIEANKEIAKSYYENQPRINYIRIVK